MDNIKATMITTYHLDRVLSSLVADQDGYLRYSHRLEKGHNASIGLLFCSVLLLNDNDNDHFKINFLLL